MDCQINQEQYFQDGPLCVCVCVCVIPGDKPAASVDCVRRGKLWAMLG